MKNWITHQNSTIDLDSVQSFHIDYISFKQEYVSNYPVGYTPSNHFAIIFHFNNHKVDWKFDNNEEAQKVFNSLQEKIGINTLQEKPAIDFTALFAQDTDYGNL